MVEVDQQIIGEMDFGVSKVVGVVVVEMMEAEVVMGAVKLVKVELGEEIQVAMAESHQATRKRHLKLIQGSYLNLAQEKRTHL